MKRTSKQTDFQTIYTMFSPQIYRLCLGYMGGNKFEAEDLLQEVFVKVWQNIDKFREDAKLSTWIYRIGVNTCLQHIRSQKNKNKIKILLYSENIPIHSISDNSENKQNEKIVVLHKCINQLAKQDRVIISLVLEELSYSQIAEITKVSEATLRVKIHRIKSKLIQLYSTYEKF